MRFATTVAGHVNGEAGFWIERRDDHGLDRWDLRYRGWFVEAFGDLADAMDEAEHLDATLPTEPDIEGALALWVD